MQSDGPQTALVIPADLGLVENYDLLADFERIVTGKNPLRAGEIFLRATLDEMIQIVALSKSLQEDCDELLREPLSQHANLKRKLNELKDLNKRKSIFRPFLFIAIRHAKRAFREDTRALLISTMSKSERLKRQLISTAAANLAPAQSETLGIDQRVSGVVVSLPPPGEMNAPGVQEALAVAEEMASILAFSGNPFAESSSSTDLSGQSPTASSLFDSESPLSPRSSIATTLNSPTSTSSYGSLNVNINCNIINNVHSDAPGSTINNNASESSGSRIVLEQPSFADKTDS